MLDEIYHHSECITPLLLFIEKSTDPILRRYGIIGLEECIYNLKGDKSFKTFEEIFNWIINKIIKETDFLCQKALCKVLSTLASLWDSKEVVAEVVKLSKHWIENDEMTIIVLHLWHFICPKNILISENEDQFIMKLLDVTMKALSSKNQEMRIVALELLNDLIWMVNEMYIIDDNNCDLFPQIGEGIQKLASDLTQQTEINSEMTGFFSFYSDIFEIEHPYLLNNNIPEITRIALRAIQNQEIPKNIRTLIHMNMIGPAYQYIVKNLQNELPLIIECSIKLALECCNENRKDELYEFPEEFFSDLIELEKNIALLLQSYIQQFLESDDLAEHQIGFMLIRSEAAVLNFNQAIKFLLVTLSYGDIDDELIVYSCCQTIEIFIRDQLQSVAYLFSNVLQYLMKYVKSYEIFQTIECLLANCKMPLHNLSDFIIELINLLPNATMDQAYSILYCLSLSIENTDTIDENIYLNIRTILFSTVELHSDFRGPILNCFGNFIKVSPKSVTKDLELIFNIIINSLSSPLEPVFVFAINCINNFIEYIPNTVSKYITKDILDIILTIMNINIPSSEEMLIEGNLSMFNKSKQTCTNCLLKLAREIQTFSQEFATSLWITLCTKINPPYEQTVNNQSLFLDEQFYDGCIMLKNGAKLFVENDFPIYEISSLLLQPINTSDNTKTVIAILEAFHSIMKYIKFEKIFDKVSLERFININLRLSDGVLTCSFPNQKYSQIPISLRRCIFISLSLIIDHYGNSIKDYFEQIYETLKHDLNWTPKLNQLFIFHLFAKILYYCPYIGDNLLEKLYASIIELIKENYDWETQSHVYISLGYLIRILNINIKEHSSILLHNICILITNDSFGIKYLHDAYTIVWCMLMMIFNFEFNETSYQILQTISPQPNSELLPFFNEFAYYIINKINNEITIKAVQRISVALFASSFNLLTRIPKNILQFNYSIIQQIELDEILNICNYNESYINTIQKNINKLNIR